MKDQIEYIEYLKSFENDVLDASLILFNKCIIDFNELETIALENECLSKKVYFKVFKIGNILND